MEVKEFLEKMVDILDTEEKLARMECLPEVLAGKRYYRPGGQGKEQQVKERLDDDWFEYLLGRYQAVKEELEFFEYAVGQLSGRLPEVVRDMVMEDMTWREMAEKYNVSETMIAKYRKKALAEMKELYLIREKTAGRFLLE